MVVVVSVGYLVLKYIGTLVAGGTTFHFPDTTRYAQIPTYTATFYILWPPSMPSPVSLLDPSTGPDCALYLYTACACGLASDSVIKAHPVNCNDICMRRGLLLHLLIHLLVLYRIIICNLPILWNRSCALCLASAVPVCALPFLSSTTMIWTRTTTTRRSSTAEQNETIARKWTICTGIGDTTRHTTYMQCRVKEHLTQVVWWGSIILIIIMVSATNNIQ